MIPLDEVRARILDTVAMLPAVEVPLAEALGLATAAPLRATWDVPPFPNTGMDGYAVRAADTAGASPESPVRLVVVDELPAGRAPTVPVEAGQAIRIMTGAPIPAGADGIVMVEETAVDGDGVLVRREVGAGDHIRPAGGDLRAGAAAFPAGTVLTPAHLGVVASLGHATVPVVRRPRVAVMSTGDELTPPGEPLSPGRITDTNRLMLCALVTQTGCQAVDLGIARDDETVIRERLEHAVGTCDSLVTTGGVSMGEYDLVKKVLDEMGALNWWQVAIKPAKPLAFGLVEGRPVFGLPGNPVSSHVSFELFARPALLQMMGHPWRFRPVVEAVAEHDMRRRRDGKLHLDRVRVRREDSRLVAASTGVQASNVLSAMALANALALIPDGEGLTAGDLVQVMLLDAPADH
ncbi:MAG: molybdopterin molybdotransferase MoeA [Actinomycetota bacterium]|nr:molybdopterin molybdotransferase MoeA [Actinomycetota bacterium]